MFGMGKRKGKRKLRQIQRPLARTADKVADTVDPQEVQGPSPNPMTNLVLADIMLRGAGELARHGVERALLGRGYTPERAKHVLDGRSLRQTLVGAALARVATRSVPGAIVVGGGMLAKTLYDRSRGGPGARAEGQKELARQAKRGK